MRSRPREKGLQVEHRESEQTYRSAVIAEGEESQEQKLNGTGNLSPEIRERLEIRSKANVRGLSCGGSIRSRPFRGRG